MNYNCSDFRSSVAGATTGKTATSIKPAFFEMHVKRWFNAWLTNELSNASLKYVLMQVHNQYRSRRCLTVNGIMKSCPLQKHL